MKSLLAPMFLSLAVLTLLPATAQPTDFSTPPPAPGASAKTPPALTGAHAKLANDFRGRFSGLQIRLFKMKRRVAHLKAQMRGAAATSRLELVHRNEFGAFLKVQSVRYFLDGKELYAQVDNKGSLASRMQFEVYNGSIDARNHALSVEMVVRGNGGVFTYLDSYQFTIRSSYSFYVPRGQTTTITVVGHQRGDVGTDLRDRPHVSYRVRNRMLPHKRR